MYADKITDSMQKAIDETKRRREIQEAYNNKHGVTPMTIQKDIRDVIRATQTAENQETYTSKITGKKMTAKERNKLILNLETEMKEAAKALDFERAAELRDVLFELKSE